ncbi:MAG: type III-A CRISPR-associated RAMP protein Csm5, partial [bacterium]
MKSVEKYNFELYPLTPIFIGSNDSWEPNEYLLRDGRIVKVKIDRVLKRIYQRSEEEVNEFARASAADLPRAVEILRNELQEGDIQETYPLKNGFERAYQEKLASSSEILTVNLPCRHATESYIPGSSLKGAIRTALYALIGQESNHPPEKKVFGYKYPFDDPFKRFRISDVNVDNDKFGLRTLQRFNIKDNKPGGPDSYAICVNGLIDDADQDPAEVSSLPEHPELKLSGDVEFVTNFSKMAEHLNVQSIINATREFSRNIMEYEKTRPVVGKWYSR